jgi:hypothetical protein
MKALLAILAIGSVGASIDWCTRGYALDAEQPEEDTTTTKPMLSQGALGCALTDSDEKQLHVLLCRFEETESCALVRPKPLRVVMKRFHEIKILEISSTPEGCSKITFSGSLKTR